MGMNYYAKINLKEAIQDCSYISPTALECIKKFNLHIGKSSIGWKFGFQRHEIYNGVLDSFKAWREFLDRNDIEIWNEDNEVIDKEWFYNRIVEKQKEEHPNQEDIDRYPEHYEKYAYVDEDGYRFDREDFS